MKKASSAWRTSKWKNKKKRMNFALKTRSLVLKMMNFVKICRFSFLVGDLKFTQVSFQRKNPDFLFLESSDFLFLESSAFRLKCFVFILQINRRPRFCRELRRRSRRHSRLHLRRGCFHGRGSGPARPAVLPSPRRGYSCTASDLSAAWTRCF